MRITQKELNKLIKSSKISKGNKKVENKEQEEINEKELKEVIRKDKNNKYLMNRLKRAEMLLSNMDVSDKVMLTKDNEKCLLIFNDIDLISNNGSLRLGARKMKKYKELWHKRVDNLISEEFLERWKKNKEFPIKMEFIYEVYHNRKMDYDGRIAAIKAPLDGLVEAKLLFDDTDKYLPIILGRQRKSINKKNNLLIILSIEKNEDRFYSEEFLKEWNR